MMEWLLLPIDSQRISAVDFAIAWHARLMVLAWGILLPLGVLIARFFKVTPRQSWPEQCDNRFWWRWHLILQYSGGVLMGLALAALVWERGFKPQAHPHAIFGYAALTLAALQYLNAWLRGTMGGPSEPVLRGDHYDMTLRRRIFEHLHKTLGYIALFLSLGAISSGLWRVNAPRWMWIVLGAWWLVWLLAFALFQRLGKAIDTYQAIWGPAPDHPGNARKPIGWGIRRKLTANGEET